MTIAISCFSLAILMAGIVSRAVLREHVRKESEAAYWDGYRKAIMFPWGTKSEEPK